MPRFCIILLLCIRRIELQARDERVVKITHAVRKSQELSPSEKERVRSLLAEQEWERLKGFLEML